MSTNIIRKILRLGALTLILFPALALAIVSNPGQLTQSSARFSAMAVSGGAPQEEMISQLMVKPRHRDGDQLNTELHAHNASRLAKTSKVGMSVLRAMSGNAHVIRLNTPVTLSEARIIAARLMSDSSVEIAEPDHRKRAAFTPTDPSYTTNQWNLFVPSAQNLGSANLPNAWSITKGSNAVTVAVIDTGYRPHADFGTVILPGYDFIADIPTANDSNGRDSDAQDPGDWITGAENTTVGGTFYGCGTLDSRNRPLNHPTPSSWHGTHVAGVIAAQMNSIGIAGMAPNVQILPVRVLGKCGGYDSDIIDGMRWAAGITVAGVSANPNPARVLNLSLGGTGGTACSSAYQSAVTEIINKGKVIVVAAGNDGSSTLSSPANCTGVIAVTANSIDGDNAWYATIGTGTTISAPGGDCGGMNYPYNCTTANSVGVTSLLNSGATTPGADSYAAYSGTSMATPHVAAVAALMFSLNPLLTPAQITSYLQSSARPFPSNTICTTNGVGQCGAGLLDAYQALVAVQPASAISSPVVTLGNINNAVTSGTVVTLSGTATTATGQTITSYAWTQLSGPANITITNPASNTNASFTAPATTGSYTFKLTATDSGGLTGTANITITISAAPTIANPVVTLGAIPTSATAGAAVTLSGSALAGTGRSITTYTWTQLSGPATVIISNPGSNTIASFTPTTPGSYTFNLTATDSSGQTGTASVVILVIPSTPVVTLGSIATSVTTDTVVTLSGSAVAVTGLSITSYTWAKLSGPAVTISNANTSTATFTPTIAGSYSFQLTATDSSGQSGTSSTIVITVSAPVSIASPISGGKGGSFDFEMLTLLALCAAGLRLQRRYAKQVI
jgi:serine protease